MKNFWQKLPGPFTVLAPLDGVTDAVFRQIITEIGKPDVLFTEFTSCDGLISDGRERVIQNLAFEKDEQPIVAQIWGTNPDNFFASAQIVKELGFSGIDINMGCPDRTIIKDGACSALLKNPHLAAEIIAATKAGAGNLPVSVKTRIGFQDTVIDEWIGFLLTQNLAALTVHLRTVKELSKVPAHWEAMPHIINLRDKLSPDTVVIGNGDIMNLTEIEEKYNTYRCEGFMVGRGIFSNPWLFNKDIKIDDVTAKQRLDLYSKHINLFLEKWGSEKNTAGLRKFCKTYINNFSYAKELREKLMETGSIAELKEILTSYREHLESPA